MSKIYSPNSYLAVFKRLGLLVHLTDDELKSLQAQAENTNFDYPVNALDFLDHGRDLIWNIHKLGEDEMETHMAAHKLQALAHERFVPDFEAAPSPIEIFSAIETANQQLAQSDSDARFYWMMYGDDGMAGPLRSWALIFLEYEQRHDPELQRLLPFAADQLHTWMPRRIDDLFAHLKEIGLLAAYTEEQITTTRNEVETLEPLLCRTILECFPGLIYSFDAEYIYDHTKDYLELIANTAKISREVFTPSNIRCTDLSPNDYNVTLSFDFNGQHFEKTLHSPGDWVNFDYLCWINDVLAEQGQLGAYRQVITGDQCAILIFFTSDQLAEALDKQWIALEDEIY